MNFIKQNKLTVLVSILMLSIVFNGCKTTLEVGGVYQGDKFLYQTDQTLAVQKATLDAFLTWEMQNRETITNQWPQVTVAADKIRTEAPMWFAVAGLAREQYIAMQRITNMAASATAKSNLTFQVSTLASNVIKFQTTSNFTR